MLVSMRRTKWQQEHHLYADDTQLFLSFLLTHFDSSIDHLQNALHRISSWVTANLLTLNSSKTEFLLIGLSKQLAKIHNFSLNTTHSARNLSFIFDERLTFSDQISSVSKSCHYHICQLRCIRPYLHTKTASTIATSTVYSKLDYCNSLYHNLRKSQITRLQQIQNSLIQSHHFHSPVSALVKNNRAHLFIYYVRRQHVGLHRPNTTSQLQRQKNTKKLKIKIHKNYKL